MKGLEAVDGLRVTGVRLAYSGCCCGRLAYSTGLTGMLDGVLYSLTGMFLGSMYPEFLSAIAAHESPTRRDVVKMIARALSS
jgi:hypothetical protein